jgi:4'-phosphopantetheinyl transferase
MSIDRPPDAPSALHPCHCRVWHCPADRERRGELEQRCEALLDPQELRDADRYRLITTRNQHIVGRAMARQLLAAGQVTPQAIRFTAEQFGKPQVLDPAALRRPFNIAHTDGLVLCGVAEGAVDAIGVDVECLGRRTTTELAERYFAEPEIRWLRAQPAAQQHAFFLRIWTLKEAFIKAIGTGLRTPLSQFAFVEIASQRPRIEFLSPELDDGRRWDFVCAEPRRGYLAAAAVASHRRPDHLTIDWQPFEGLLDVL